MVCGLVMIFVTIMAPFMLNSLKGFNQNDTTWPEVCGQLKNIC